MRMMTSFISGVFTAGMAALRGGSTAPNEPLTADLLANGGVMRTSWRMDKAGRISDLQQVQEPLAGPGNGEVRVAVKAVGLNMAGKPPTPTHPPTFSSSTHPPTYPPTL